MNIELKQIPIGELVDGYQDRGEAGVVGFGGKLDIRPPYQREFIYNDKQRNEVIYTVKKGFPLNVMYWVQSDENSFEIMDGQQRSLSICQFATGEFSLDWDGHPKNFNNLTAAEQRQFLDYELHIYTCQGTDKEKLDWFQIINIAGEKLTNQELRNAVYHGKWTTNAKAYFSKSNGPVTEYSDYLTGALKRQDFLETAIDWVSGGKIEDYMLSHVSDDNASELWARFQTIINWVKTTFPNYRKEMKGINWGELYDANKNKRLNPQNLEEEVAGLMADDEVSNKKGIYAFVLGGGEKHLSLRAFSDSQKREAYEVCGGVCAKCGKHFELSEMEADHITPWSQGGKTEIDNCQMLCRECNRRKGVK